tara:strand:+ start:781 stop:906 length:126 start_codon:yes stop_codon:yes gene_type:complete
MTIGHIIFFIILIVAFNIISKEIDNGSQIPKDKDSRYKDQQ